VREAAAWAWKGYAECAGGEDELRPLSCAGQHFFNLTITAADALDTLLLMRLDAEFDAAAALVTRVMAPAAARDVNVFEVTIRVLGGLLAAARLAEPSRPAVARRLLEQAADLGARLARGLDSDSGIPFSDVDLSTGSVAGAVPLSSTSEAGSLSLEFTLLARLGGRPELEAAALRVHDALAPLAAASPLLPKLLRRADGAGQGGELMLGARTDSYYEYLLKQWVLTGREDARLLERYVAAMRAVRARLLRRTAPGGAGLLYVGEATPGAAAPAAEGAEGDAEGEGNVAAAAAPDTLSPKMDHLVCFLPGVLALGDLHGVDTRRPGASPPDAPDLEVAAELAATCYALYARTPTGLAPEIAHFAPHAGGAGHYAAAAGAVGGGDFGVKPADAHALLRPEAVESLFVMWKTTGDPVWRERAWAVFRSLERWARVEGAAQCLGADPASAAAALAREAAGAAGAAAAAAARRGTPPAEALRAAEATGEAAVVAALDGAVFVDEDDEAWTLLGARAAARAAAAAVVAALAGAPLPDADAPAGAAARAAAAAAVAAAAAEHAAAECGAAARGGGYASLASVTELPPRRRDHMESFFLAETLKYLFLIFDEPPDRCLHASCAGAPLPPARASLREVVFNTEAHPLPVVGPRRASAVAPAGLDPRLFEPYAAGGGAYTAPWAGAGAAAEESGDGGEEDLHEEL
jgi:hypothetical protein